MTTFPPLRFESVRPSRAALIALLVAPLAFGLSTGGWVAHHFTIAEVMLGVRFGAYGFALIVVHAAFSKAHRDFVGHVDRMRAADEARRATEQGRLEYVAALEKVLHDVARDAVGRQRAAREARRQGRSS